MKTIRLIITLALLAGPLVSCQEASTSEPPTTEEQQAKITLLETQLQDQTGSRDRWQTLSVLLGAGCLVFLIVGTAIGTKTRHDASPS